MTNFVDLILNLYLYVDQQVYELVASSIVFCGHISLYFYLVVPSMLHTIVFVIIVHLYLLSWNS